MFLKKKFECFQVIFIKYSKILESFGLHKKISHLFDNFIYK